MERSTHYSRIRNGLPVSVIVRVGTGEESHPTVLHPGQEMPAPGFSSPEAMLQVVLRGPQHDLVLAQSLVSRGGDLTGLADPDHFVTAKLSKGVLNIQPATLPQASHGGATSAGGNCAFAVFNYLGGAGSSVYLPDFSAVRELFPSPVGHADCARGPAFEIAEVGAAPDGVTHSVFYARTGDDVVTQLDFGVAKTNEGVTSVMYQSKDGLVYDLGAWVIVYVLGDGSGEGGTLTRLPSSAGGL